MKMTEQHKKVQENMQAGTITAPGFLGHDQRPLIDIISADEAEMARLQLDWDEVAKRMRAILKAGIAGMGDGVTFEKKLLVRVDEARGRMPCPWEDGIFPKLTAQVQELDANTNQGTGPTVIFNELIIHLVQKHHFLQGRGSAYRIEPIDFIKLLG